MFLPSSQETSYSPLVGHRFQSAAKLQRGNWGETIQLMMVTILPVLHALIASLVNRAYRPSVPERGWTHEANLVSGPRTTEEQVLSLDCSRSSILVLCQDTDIVACIHVKCGENSADIGMLATDPNHQMQGLGKQILNCAEQYALKHFGITTFKMSVLSSRTELIAFYERRGYARAGEVSSYPISAGIGEPILDGLQVEILVKQIATLSSQTDNQS
jgi:ribosomal protein S18 acetylase RimI-like enzyme